MTTQQEEKEALDSFRVNIIEAYGLEPVRRISLLDVGAVWVELDSAQVMKKWAAAMHIVDATAGTYDKKDEYLRLNVRGRLEEVPVVVTLPAHWGTQPHMITVIRMRISDRDPAALVAKLAAIE